MKRFLIAMLSLALVAAACGDDDTDEASAPADGESADHNAADIAFLEGMIPHHEQAIEMSALALEHSDNAQVTDLAQRISAAQEPEIETMQGLLEDWGADDGSGGGHDEHGGDSGAEMDAEMDMDGGGHPGMLTDDQLQALREARGAEFDRLFLTGMIEHHRGAVTSSEKELAEGQSEEARRLAQQIIDAQEAEIAEMEQLSTTV